MKRHWLFSGRLWLGLTVSGVCLWLALHSVPFADLKDILRHADYRWLLPAAAIQLAAVVIRARRWVVLLRLKGHLITSFWAQGVGYLFTNLLPLRMGEPARVIVMAERTQLPVMQVAATAIVERLLDVTTIILALLIVLPFMDVPDFAAQAGMTFGVLVIIGFIGLLLAVRLETFSERLLRALLARFPILTKARPVERWRDLLVGLRCMTQISTAAPAIFWSLITWTFSILTYWCVFRAFQPDATLVEAVFVVVALSLAITVPSSPGFIGVFQLAGQQALVLPFGDKYTSASALSIIISAHLLYYGLSTSLGIIGLWRIGDSFGSVFAALRRSEPPATAAPAQS